MAIQWKLINIAMFFSTYLHAEIPEITTKSSFLYSVLGLLLALALTLTFMLSNKRKKHDQDSMPTTAHTTLDKTSEKPRIVLRASANFHEEVGGSGINSQSPAPPHSSSVASPQRNDDLTKALSLVDEGHPKEALVLLQKVLQENPNDESTLVEMGMIYLLDFKNPSAAAPFFERALSLNPQNNVVLTELVSVYDETDQMDQGLIFLQTILENHPEASNVAMGIGQILSNKNQSEEAIVYLKQAAADDRNEGAKTELADAYSTAGRHEDALNAYNVVVENIKQKISSGDYREEPEAGDEKLAMAYLDVAAQHLQNQEFDEAKEIISVHVKGLLKNEDAIEAILERLQVK